MGRVDLPGAIAQDPGAPPVRWDGHVRTGDVTIKYFYGEFPAAWLGARGVHLDVRGLRGPDPAVDVVMPGGAPVLFDSLAARLARWLRCKGPT